MLKFLVGFKPKPSVIFVDFSGVRFGMPKALACLLLLLNKPDN